MKPLRGSQSLVGCLVIAGAMGSATVSVAMPLPPLQVLEWGAQDNYEMPANSHFGERFALQRSGATLLITAPNDGARSGYVFDDVEGWYDESWTLSTAGAQFFELAPDVTGVAFTRRMPDDTTEVRLHHAFGAPSALVLGGIPGLVTAIAKQGSVLAVGEAAHAGGAGRVRVFESVAGEFVLAATFVGQAGAGLGQALALDGPILVAGAPGQGACGAVHVYANAADWVDIQTIDCPASSQVDTDFGTSVAYDGDVIAVGAPRLDRLVAGGANEVDAGGVYVFRPQGLVFALETFLRPAETEAGDRFGSSLAVLQLAGNNAALLAGSPLENGGGTDSGAAYLFLDWGDEWRLHRRLATNESEAGMRQGTEVALGFMGALVGAPRYDGNFVADQGAVIAWNGVVPIFYDGFDRGDVSAWSNPARPER